MRSSGRPSQRRGIQPPHEIDSRLSTRVRARTAAPGHRCAHKAGGERARPLPTIQRLHAPSIRDSNAPKGTLMRASILGVFAALVLGCGGFQVGTPPPNGTGGGSTSDAFSQCQSRCNDGCCTNDGQCLAGTSRTACGSSGNLCETCPDANRCEITAAGGSCRPCSQLNCSGCCALDGQCLAGTSTAACGYAGKTCADCGSGFCELQSFGGGVCR